MNMVLNALPDLSSQLRSLQTALQEKSERIASLEEELRQEKTKGRSMEAGVTELRRTLSPLHHALELVFGQIDVMDVHHERASAPVSDAKSAVWESWKKRLGGATAKTIDLLLLHGELTQNQIRIHLGTNRMQTVYDVVSKLNKAGIINKVGGNISLKEL